MTKLMSKKVTKRVAIVSLICTLASNAWAQNAASIDDGNRLIAPYHWKIEHRATSVIDNFVHQLGTPEGRAILGAVGAAVGFDPTVVRMVTANIPLPGIDPRATDNKGVLTSPIGMTVCRAGKVGTLEASHASWSSRVVRSGGQDGLAYYTSVGTSPGTTHRVMGDFWVEYVKPIEGWQGKFNCMADGQLVWDVHG